MPIFFERFILPALAAIAVSVVLINPMKFDLCQRISLIVALEAVAYFIGHTLHKASVAQKVATDSAIPTTTGNALTSRDDSPVTAPPSSGDGATQSAPNKQGEKPHKPTHLQSVPITPAAPPTLQSTTAPSSSSPAPPQVPTGGNGLYERVVKASRDIGDWSQKYRQRISEIKAEAGDRAQLVIQTYRRSLGNTPDKDELAQMETKRQQADDQMNEEIKRGYFQLNKDADASVENHKNDLTTPHDEAIAHMERLKPDVWTPNLINTDVGQFGTAMTQATQSSEYDDLEHERINVKRFDPLESYLNKLAVELGDYPDKAQP